ncbi:MAG: DUF4159 domain-containing protein, partial [Alphaproteobacteria bacterium]|nr:DUF4159 domain-containing protein [Alphaproteobacteria bacterium]
RSDTAKLLLPPTLDGAQLKLNARRLGGGPAETLVVRAVADRGEVLARERLEFVADAVIATAPLALPTELRNRVARIEVEGERSAGTTVLLDERWRRRPVGLVAGGTLETDQPLLSDLYYLTRALNPFVELREGSVDALLKRPLAVMVLADVGQVVGGDFSALENWVEKGGVLLRFAGPRLAQSADALVPVKLRGGGRRSLDGAMSWAQPARMAEFPAESPFFGLAVPDDVVVRRQVLAEPARDLARKTWARLSDGTPLVTGEKRGAGWVILVHTTANTAWSSLPLSGMFVEMLRRVVALSQGVAGQEGAGGAMPPLSMLDAFGVLGPPNSGILPLTDSVEGTRVSPKQPPGFYGTQDARRALNLGPSVGEPRPLPPMPSGALSAEYSGARELDLLPWLLVAALSLGLIDLIASLALRGLLPWRLGVAGAAMLACMVVSPPRPAAADDKAALLGTLETKLAYVLTGNREVDEISRNGMRGLSDMLNRRTSIEPTEPVGLDIERDEILFYPFVYWPVIAEQKDLSPAALAKLDHFMKTGGTVLFDTRDAGQIVPFVESGGQGARRLRALLSKLDIPPLVPVPPDHVLTKAFYLLQEFPGRYAGGPLWVERHSENVNDGVASVIIGGNDWAAAWATDTEGRPLYAISPGGERQRETAFRFGINLLMYVMTGNYKADQVHVPAILERLGQ